MGLDQHALPVFAGHQTFHPRFGWLKKGLDACAADPNVFNAEDAPLRLGVGKNMVEAIRFWCLATRVIVRVKSPEGKRQYLHVPSKLGQSLLSENGLDPYFEQQGTLWLLHWQATSSQTLLPVWWCAFNELQALEFDGATPRSMRGGDRSLDVDGTRENLCQEGCRLPSAHVQSSARDR